MEATYFKRENVKTTHYGIQSVIYLGPKVWDMMPNNIKNCSSLNKFKNSIKSWKPNECPHRLRKKIYCSIDCHHLLYLLVCLLPVYFLLLLLLLLFLLLSLLFLVGVN